MAETTQIDKLFLELSQFSTATTEREIRLEQQIVQLKRGVQRAIWSIERQLPLKDADIPSLDAMIQLNVPRRAVQKEDS